MTTATACPEAPPDGKKKPKPDMVPKWKVGDVVTTKFQVKVKHAGVRGRKFFFVLPRAEWTVRAVEANGPRHPRYKLTCSTFTIIREEYRLRSLRANGR